MRAQWAPWHLKSPASRLFTQPFVQAQIKEIIKAPRHWPLWGEFTGGDRRIPRAKSQQRGKCFYLMTSSYHKAISTYTQYQRSSPSARYEAPSPGSRNTMVNHHQPWCRNGTKFLCRWTVDGMVSPSQFLLDGTRIRITMRFMGFEIMGNATFCSPPCLTNIKVFASKRMKNAFIGHLFYRVWYTCTLEYL